jgi:outer membrane lipoprotein SlyB
MPIHIVALPAAEALHLARAEIKAAHGQPELNLSAWKDYVIEENFSRGAYGSRGGEAFDLVTEAAVLNLEPRVERDYWILKLVVERSLGPLTAAEQATLARTEMTLDEFDEALRAAGRKRIIVRIEVETAAAKRHFDRWLAEMRARHPLAAAPVQPPSPGQPAREPVQATLAASDASSWAYGAREAVGVFRDPATLEAAVDALELSGFDRAAISVLATHGAARQRLESFYRTVAEAEDSATVPRGAYVSSNSRTEGEAAVVGLPLYIGSVAGAFAVVAAGGALALAYAVAMAAGVAGASLGALLADAIERRHSAEIEEQLREGGLILWVSVSDAEAEKRALALLESLDATDIHVHEIKREWSVRDSPFLLFEPDPFLERDRRRDS